MQPQPSFAGRAVGSLATLCLWLKLCLRHVRVRRRHRPECRRRHRHIHHHHHNITHTHQIYDPRDTPARVPLSVASTLIFERQWRRSGRPRASTSLVHFAIHSPLSLSLSPSLSISPRDRRVAHDYIVGWVGLQFIVDAPSGWPRICASLLSWQTFPRHLYGLREMPAQLRHGRGAGGCVSGSFEGY